MLKKYCLATLLLLVCFNNAFAQDTAMLVAYLDAHKYTINVGADGSLAFSPEAAQVLADRMKGKRLLVFSVGNHYLPLNDKVQPLLANELSKTGLSIYFQELGRSIVYRWNLFMDNKPIVHPMFPSSIALLNSFKPAKAHSPAFHFVGIDFERGWFFAQTMTDIVNHLDSSAQRKLYAYAPFMQDTAYISLSDKKFIRLYRKMQSKFFTDSSALKPILNDQYPVYSYMLSNPDVALSTQVAIRDRMMAVNLLNEIAAADTSAKYLLTVGMMHGSFNEKRSLVQRLNNEGALRNKVEVVNLYYDHSKLKQGLERRGYMKGDVLETFHKSAGKEMVLYDLSGLPDEYSYIRSFGAFLIFGTDRS